MIADSLRACLIPAYPCPALQDVCKDMRYDHARGLVPRGYAGATAALADVSLVLVVAEPGEPRPDAPPLPALEPPEFVDSLAARTGSSLLNNKRIFHKSVRYLLDQCWPSLQVRLDEQLKRTWITEGVLCSAAVPTAHVPRSVEHECATRYLRAQLALVPRAFVIALGDKAKRRVNMAGRTPNFTAFAAGLPAANRKKAKPSWDAAGRAFQAHLSRP